MAAIGRKDTAPELILRRALHRRGFRYRLHDRRLPGSPDLTFPKHSAAVFVHGCFWHAHDCSRCKVPTTRAAFWRAKFLRNQARDQRKIAGLIERGWRVLVVWECALPTRDVELLNRTAELVAKWLTGNRKGGKIQLTARPVGLPHARPVGLPPRRSNFFVGVYN